jgi:hypothetical protein
MTPALRFRVIGERDLLLRMEMSLLSHALYVMEVPGPDKSGHQAP